jgi:hypothetical protein
MHLRRNNRRVSLEGDQLLVEPVRGPMMAIAGSLVGAGAVACAVAGGMHRHAEPVWVLGIVWAFVAVVFAVVAYLPAPRVRVELGRKLVDLDGTTHSLAECAFTYKLVDQYAGRRRIQYYVVHLEAPGRSPVKLLELGKNEGDLAHNLVAGLDQLQRDQLAAGTETLKEAIECAPPAVNREILMVVALIVAPIFVFWLKGAF